MNTAVPPFKLPNKGALSVPAGGDDWQERKLPSGISDGLESKWPTSNLYRKSDERNYLRQLGQSWATRDGSAKPGTNYFLDRLPDGYGCFETDQPGGSQVYKRLFGHPSGRFYDSIRRFEKHFFWLLDGKKGRCECFLCGNYKGPIGPPRQRNRLDLSDRSIPIHTTPRQRNRLDPSDRSIPIHTTPRQGQERQQPQPQQRARSQIMSENGRTSGSESASGMAAERSRRTARQLTALHPVDEEGTTNVWRDAILRLKNMEDSSYGPIIDIEERDSLDWIAEQEVLQQYLTQIEQQHSFVPRRGELVLWCLDIPNDLYLVRDSRNLEYKLYSFNSRKFVGFPTWRGGVVADVPSAASKNGNVDFPDILDLPEKKTSLNTAGFRIETMPDPNDDTNKSLSKQYRYVPLRNIRPLSHWQLLLRGIPQQELHPSILYALTCMTSVSMFGKKKFKGEWPKGWIVAKGMHLGSEMITVGDAVRLVPDPPSTKCTDILIVESILYHLNDIKPEHLDNNSSTLCSKSLVALTGQAYTTMIDRAHDYPTKEQVETAEAIVMPSPVNPEVLKTIFRPVGTGEYGQWYPMHDVDLTKYEVSYDQILGRLYEADAIRLWSGQRQHKYSANDYTSMIPDLSFDMGGVIEGRRYATKTDERIPDQHITKDNDIRWLISDSRVHALTIATLNDLDVGAYHEIRTPATLAAWRAHIRHANGEHMGADITAIQPKNHRVAQNWTNNYVSSVTAIDGEKRRGRPAGSKLIDGRLYTAEQLANRTGFQKQLATNATASSAVAAGNNEVEITDVGGEGEVEEDGQTEEDEEFEPTSSQPYKSRMAGAALVSTDEEDLARGGFDTEDDKDDLRRPSKSKLATYVTTNTDGDVDIEHLDDNPDKNITIWQSKASASKSGSQSSSRQRQPPTKAQIMQSAGKGHGSTLASVQGYEDEGYDSDETEESLNIDDWKNPRNARGGTEESKGGDYVPGETQ